MCALLAVCFVAAACSAPGSDDQTAGGGTAGTGAPLLDIDSETTWVDLVESVAGGAEAACANRAYADDGLDDLLDSPVLSAAGFDGWPVVRTEFLSIDIGGNRWPHKSWRCLSDRNATAVYLSAFIQEGGLDVAAMTDADRECISQLPHDRPLSQTAARVLKSEHDLGEVDTTEFFEELSEVAFSRLFWCVSDLAGTVLEYVIDAAYGAELSDADLRCMTDAALEAARGPDIDRDELYVTLTSDDFFPDGTEFGAVFDILGAGYDTCLSDPADQNDGADETNQDDRAASVGEADPADQNDGADEAEQMAGNMATAAWEGASYSSWADLLDRFPDAERSCVVEAFDDDEVTAWLLELPIGTIFEDSAWMEGVFGCLGRESAAYASVAMIADEAEADGLALDPAVGECLRAAFVDFDMATLWRLSDRPVDEYPELAESYDAALLACVPSEWQTGDAGGPQATAIWETATNSTASPVTVSPTVIDGVVFALDYSGGVWAVDGASGDQLWSFDAGDDLAISPSGTEDLVLVSGNGEHLALDALTGSTRWVRPSSGPTLGKPAFAFGVAFFNETGPSLRSTIIAIDLATGAPLWASEVRTSDVPLLFPLAVSGNRLLVSDYTTMHALDTATGAAVWSAEVSPGAPATFSADTVAIAGTIDPAELDDTQAAEPVSCPRGGEADYCTVARDATTGEVLWYSEDLGGAVGHTAVPGKADGAFLVGGDGLHAVDARSGELLWSVPVSLLIGTPFAAGESIFVAGLSEGLMALDALTGTQKWRLEVDGSGPMALQDGVLYVASVQQEVHAIDAALGELLWTSPAVFADGDRRAFAVHDGMVFVGFQGPETGGVRSLAAPAGGS